MKKLVIVLMGFVSSAAFAGDYSINGIEFNEANIFARYRDYRSAPATAACEINVQLIKSKSFFGKTVISKNNRKATCADLTSDAIARFVNTDSYGDLVALLSNLGTRTWRENREDMSDESSANVLSCKIFVDGIQDSPLNSLCFNANYRGVFSTKE